MSGCLVVLTLLAQASPPRTGDFKDEYKDPKTKELVMRYALHAPAKLPPMKHLGLVVQFHGMNGSEDNLQGGCVDSLKRLGLLDSYVVMGGKSKGAGWTAGDDADLLKWIAWAKATYPVDPRRVFLVGMSNGGWMVRRFGWEHQDLFAGVTVYCGGGTQFDPPKGTPLPPNAADVRLEYYFVHGDADKAVGVDASRRACEQLKARGYRYVYRELDGFEHNNIWSVNDVRDDAFLWMNALRHKEMPLAMEERKSIGAFSKGDAVFQQPAAHAELSRIGGPAAGRVVGRALDSSTPAIRAAAAETCEKTLYGREIVLELMRMLTDKSDGVKVAVHKALAAAANWRYEEAQVALCKVALTKSRGANERALAAEGLGRAVKLAFYGHYEDKAMFWTLVHLLDDDEPRVREAAFKALEPAVKGGFDYRPELSAAQRKASISKWKSWCSEKCGPEQQASQ